MRPWLHSMLGILVVWSPARAQPDEPAAPSSDSGSVPVLTRIFPPGLSVGTTTEWVLTGHNLATVEQFLVTGDGIDLAERSTRPDGSVALRVRAAVGTEPSYREVRADGPFGVSNLLLIRVDHLPQVIELEPNDDPEEANEVAIPSAVAGVLGPGDLDHFRVRGRAGHRMTIEVEARRIGTPIDPLVTISSVSGAALIQGRASRGVEHDCRLSYVFPEDAHYVIQVRDSLFSGGEAAAYRLRFDDAPFATGLYPLGGPGGRDLTVAATGGSLEAPRSKTIRLPDLSGTVIEVGSFGGPGGPILAPGRLFVGEGPELDEANRDDRTRGTIRLSPGTTANGRIGRAGEVDRYVLPVRRGEKYRISVRAASLGSWLDSVVTLLDASGTVLGVADDHAGSPDSMLDHEATFDGDLIIEVADRSGDGGPEYVYRLTAGTVGTDLAVSLRLTGQAQASGALNLRPGSLVPIRFLVESEGRPGPIQIRALGLPNGVTAAPVTLRQNGPGESGSSVMLPLAGRLELRVAPTATPVLGALRLVATTRRENGDESRWTAKAILPIGPALATLPDRRVLRVVTDVPVRVVIPPR